MGPQQSSLNEQGIGKVDIWAWEEEWCRKMERARASQRLTKDDDECKFPDYCGCEICDEYVDIGGEG